VALDSLDLTLSAEVDELEIEIRVLNLVAIWAEEWNVHNGSPFWLHLVNEVRALFDGLVNPGGLLLVDLLESEDSALLDDPLEDKVGEVDWEGRRSVVEAFVGNLDTPVKGDWAEWLEGALFKKIFANDDDCHASWAEVLLGAGEDAANFLPLGDGLGKEVGGHIDDQWWLDIGELLEFDTLDGLVVAVVEVGSVIVDGPGGAVFDIDGVGVWFSGN